jgi:hypothetical protein
VASLTSFKNFVIIYIENKERRTIDSHMLNINQDEIAALQLVLRFIKVKDLLKAAQDGFSLKDSVNAIENSDLCYKAMTTFLN